MSDEAAPEEPDELRMVRRKRYREARTAGMSREEAYVFAHDVSIDVGELRHLVERGCPPELMAGILL